MRVKPLFRSKRRRGLFFYPAAASASLGACYAIVRSPYGPGEGDALTSVVLALLSAALALLLVRFIPSKAKVHKFALISSLLLPVLLVAGMLSQSEITGRPVIVGSELSRALDLASRADEDRAALSQRQYLLSLPRSQARSLAGAYQAAAQDSLAIAAFWNPAAAPRMPGSGFDVVYEVINRAADAQADALTIYIRNVEAPQASLEAAASDLAAEVEVLLSDQVLGVAISDARSASIALLNRSR